MRATVCSILFTALSTFTATCHGRAAARPEITPSPLFRRNDLLPRDDSCGSSSVTTIPGCWGVPGCAYILVPDEQACEADYCDCGGSPAPLITATADGTMSTGCGYTTLPPSACPAAPTASSQPVCKRDLSVRDDFLVVRDRKPRPGQHQWSKRVEKNIPGTNPLVSALRNLPKAAGIAKSVTGIVTNRLAHDGIQKHSLVTGLKGTANFLGKVVIDGQTMTSPMQWIVRWDYDPDKGAHVNAEFGKGSDNPTFAYTFSSAISNYGVNYMQDAVKNLMQTAGYDSATSAQTGTPTFIEGTSEADATQAIAEMWESFLNWGCGQLGAPVDNGGNPNAPP